MPVGAASKFRYVKVKLPIEVEGVKSYPLLTNSELRVFYSGVSYRALRSYNKRERTQTIS